MSAIEDELTVLYQEVAPLCLRNRKSALWLEGMFLELIRNFYSDKDHLFPGVHPYDPDCPDGTVIVGSGNWDDETEADARPAIIVDIGDLQYRAIEGYEQVTRYNLKEGEHLHTREVTGSVVFAHLSKTKGQASVYGSNTYDLFDGFSRIVRDDFGFERFDLRKVGQPTKRRDNPMDWQCLVQANFVFYENYSVKHESPKLKKIAVLTMTNILKENS